jgi:hypothetical protein
MRVQAGALPPLVLLLLLQAQLAQPVQGHADQHRWQVRKGCGHFLPQHWW